MLKEIMRDPQSVLFWTGAGISSSPPSSLPLGIALTENVINYFCSDSALPTILDYLGKAGIKDSSGMKKSHPRLEAVLESILTVTGFEALRYFSMLDVPPNILHGFFARHILQGCTHITMNIDNCIAKALLNLNDSKWHVIENSEDLINTSNNGDGLLIHLHGRYKEENDEENNLGVRIKAIAAGFDEAMKVKLQDLLQCMHWLIFVGYSGSDYFDVNPFFNELKKRGISFSDLTVIWVDHCVSGDTLDKYILKEYSSIKSDFRKSILDALEGARAKVFIWRGETARFMEDIWPAGLAQKSCVANTATHSVAPPENFFNNALKPIVTANLYLSMGMGSEVLNLQDELLECRKQINSMKPIQNSLISLKNWIIHILNEAYCEIGYYKKAHQILQDFQEQDDIEKAFKYQRLAGDYWLSGAVLRSWFYFKKSFKILDGIPNCERNERWKQVLIETDIRFLHLCMDIYRIPFIKYFLPEARVFEAFHEILGMEEQLRRLPYDRIHLLKIYRRLPFVAQTINLPDWINNGNTAMHMNFAEMDNILGVINYTRDSVTEELNNGKTVSMDDLTKLMHKSLLIHDHPGILKCALIIKRNYGIDSHTVKIVLSSICKVQWVFMRKLCWLSSYFLKPRKNGKS